METKNKPFSMVFLEVCGIYLDPQRRSRSFGNEKKNLQFKFSRAAQKSEIRFTDMKIRI